MAKFEHNSEKFGYLDLERLLDVQKALAALGFDPGKIDGKDGPNTQNAVRQFQARATIKIDGIVGEQTRSSLLNELDKAQRAPAPTAV
jgi:peptidoglycan hydrolase-like protein with peptidoglycan-binding domain